LVYVVFQNWMQYLLKVIVLKPLNHFGLIFRMNNFLHMVHYRIEKHMQQTLYNVGHKTYLVFTYGLLLTIRPLVVMYNWYPCCFIHHQM
jgi:hypothetical protein